MMKQGKKNLEESILNWYEFRREARLLEIAEPEASLASLFRRRCDHVTSIDLTEKGPEFPQEHYDYIICLQAIERVREPLALLQQCLDHLKEKGTLLLGAENRLGLKYLCGCGEKYSNIPFEGVNDYLCNETEERCYSKRELSNLLKAASAPNVKFYYPVPDGRMPQMIFTDDYHRGINAAERLNDYNYEDPAMTGLEHRIFSQMIDEGAIGFLSNFFLVEITKGAPLSDIIYAVVTTDRGKDYGMATTIRSSHQVIKRPLYQEGEKNLQRLYGYTVELKEKGIPVVEMELSEDSYGLKAVMSFVEAEGLSSVLEGFLQTDPQRFDLLMDRIYDSICRSCTREGDRERVFVDLAPCNAFYSQGNVLFYDQEFVLEDAGADFAMYRTLKYFFASSKTARKCRRPEDMYARYHIDPMRVGEYEQKECQFINRVRRKDQFSWLYQVAVPSYSRIIRNMRGMERQAKPYHVGYVPGVFDLLHKGHLYLIDRCKARCEYLIVGVLTDELVEYYKGKRPVISYEDRAELLAGLKSVDQVVPVDFSNTDKLKAWEQLHYDCHFSGDDHIEHWNDVWEKLKERGSNMEFFSYTEGISSSQIRRKMGGTQNESDCE